MAVRAAIEGQARSGPVALDFRMSSTCLFSDIVLPTATRYEKTIYECLRIAIRLSTPFPPRSITAQESKATGEIYKGIASVFSEVCQSGHSGQRLDVVLHPLQRGFPGGTGLSHLIFSTGVKASAELIPGKTAPNIVVVERDYPAPMNVLPRWVLRG